MLACLIYTAKVAAALIVFYLFFRLLLSRETFHRLNRIVLLSGVVISFLLPLCIITVNITINSARTSHKPNYLWTHDTGVDWWVIVLFGIFLFGALATLARLLIALHRVNKMIKQGEKHPQPDGNTLVIIDSHDGERHLSPSSWMGYIFLRREDFLSAEMTGLNNSPVYCHEAAHSALHHSLDLLFLDLCLILQWFNPAIWLLRRQLAAIHEYEADKSVLDKGFNTREYQLLLVQKSMSDTGYSVVNNFNHSALKGRIDMMLRRPSRSRRASRVLVLIPLVCLGLAMNARWEFQIGQGRPYIILGDNDNIILRVDGKEFDKGRMDEIDPHKIKSVSVKKDGKGGGTIDIYLNNE